MDPQELTYLEEERCYIIPEGVRPVLKTFRIEVTHTHSLNKLSVDVLQMCLGHQVVGSVKYPVCFCVCVQVLFWGLRELKRVQLFEVERPMVRVECAGRQLESEEIESYQTHPNFKELVRYLDVVSCFH